MLLPSIYNINHRKKYVFKDNIIVHMEEKYQILERENIIIERRKLYKEKSCMMCIPSYS